MEPVEIRRLADVQACLQAHELAEACDHEDLAKCQVLVYGQLIRKRRLS